MKSKIDWDKVEIVDMDEPIIKEDDELDIPTEILMIFDKLFNAPTEFRKKILTKVNLSVSAMETLWGSELNPFPEHLPTPADIISTIFDGLNNVLYNETNTYKTIFYTLPSNITFWNESLDIKPRFFRKQWTNYGVQD